MHEIPDLSNRPQTPDAELRPAIEQMASGRRITRDQERIALRALEDADFALLANRALQQGADPEFLRRTSPFAFAQLARKIGLSAEQAHAAIERAHKFGPGSFAEDSAEEMLWLLMVKHSADEMENAHATCAEIVRRSAHHLVEFERYASQADHPEQDAREHREELIRITQPIGIAEQGENIPLYTSDIGHYLAYRSGHPVAAVRASNGLVFYGTDGSVTLSEAGIACDKQISDFFGIVFPK